MFNFFKKHVTSKLMGFELLKYIGPGLLVTIGFIDPGNWATNVAAGSMYGYKLLWITTLSTLILVVLQHHSAHLGIATGMCLAEASTKYYKKYVSLSFLLTSMLAIISTSLAEILGAAIGLNMLFGLPLYLGSIFSSILVFYMLVTHSYRKIEKWIIGFVSLIGVSFIYELFLVRIGWGETARSWITPSVPLGSMPIIMGVLGAVVMPHNLFLHSEIIQSRNWNLEDEKTIKRQLKYEFVDTAFSMVLGWAINSAMIILAAATFFYRGINVTELPEAQVMLKPILGNFAAIVFAVALVCAGIASLVTAGIAGASVFSGMFGESLDLDDIHSRTGVFVALACALLVIFFLQDPFKGIIISQIALSMQLPFTILALIFLTSSEKVMGIYANDWISKALQWSIAAVVITLNILLVLHIFKIVSF